jgi:hypothetical protein
MPGGPTDREGLAPQRPPVHWGPKRAQTPSGERTRPGSQPRRRSSERRQASRALPQDPPPTHLRTGGSEGPPRPDRPTPLGGAARRTTGPTDQPPSGARRAGPARGLEASAPDAAPRRSSEHPEPREAPPPTNGTLAPRQRPPGDPLGGQRAGNGSHRPDGDPLGGHPNGSGTAKGIATARTATPSGATRTAAAPRRAPRSPTQPKARDQRTALWKEPKAQGSIEQRPSGNAELLATDYLVAQGLEVGRPAEPDRTHVATRAESPQKRQGTTRGQRPWRHGTATREGKASKGLRHRGWSSRATRAFGPRRSD